MSKAAFRRENKGSGRKAGPSGLDPGPLPQPERKIHYVRQMFSRIAGRYDLMNRLMTLGRDRAWRRYTVSQLVVDSARAGSMSILDVATGTGDLALEALRQHPDAYVVGLDFVPEMLALAREKGVPARHDALVQSRSRSPALLAGDALRIPFTSGAFDAVVTGFALRNVADITAAFAEMARVTRPGGRMSCLEIAKPRLPLFRQLFTLYFYRLVPLLGRWITGQPSAYTYLPHSLTEFLSPDQIVRIMQQVGWRDVGYKQLMMGTVVVHVGVREGVSLPSTSKDSTMRPKKG